MTDEETVKRIDEIREKADEEIAEIRQRVEKLHEEIGTVKLLAAVDIGELKPEIEVIEGHSEVTHFDSGRRVFDCALCYEEGDVGDMVEIDVCEGSQGGMWLFNHFALAGTDGRPVCDACAKKYALPDLFAARKAAFETIEKRAADAATYEEFVGAGTSAA